MRRRLFNLAAAVSLVLCTATGVLWARSYGHCDWIHHLRSSVPRDRSLHAFREMLRSGREFNEVANDWGSERGTLFWSRVEWTRMILPGQPGWYIYSEPLDGGRHITGDLYLRFGFGLMHTNQDRLDSIEVAIPHWFVLLFVLALPARWIVLARRRCADRTTCPACGYDLRATPERCPECGTSASAVAGQGNAPVAR